MEIESTQIQHMRFKCELVQLYAVDLPHRLTNANIYFKIE